MCLVCIVPVLCLVSCVCIMFFVDFNSHIFSTVSESTGVYSTYSLIPTKCLLL